MRTPLVHYYLENSGQMAYLETHPKLIWFEERLPALLARAIATQAQLPWLWRQPHFVSPCIRSLRIISLSFANILLTEVLVASRIWIFTRSICLCRSASFFHRHGSRWPRANGRRPSRGGQAWSAPGVRRIQSRVSEDLLRYVMMMLFLFPFTLSIRFVVWIQQWR